MTVTPLPVLRPAPYKFTITARSPKHAATIREEAKFMDPGLKVEDASRYDDQIREVLARQRAPFQI
jgi:hypothetical protein